jgi:hypothetical protein
MEDVYPLVDQSQLNQFSIELGINLGRTPCSLRHGTEGPIKGGLNPSDFEPQQTQPSNQEHHHGHANLPPPEVIESIKEQEVVTSKM